jgi:predicted RNase H-like HicB family nuclease
MKSVLAQFNIQLPALVIKKSERYVSSCPVLDVYSQGDTLEQAKKNLSEALSLFFISCYERGTLETVLRNCGFRPVTPGHVIPKQSQMDDYINVPLPFMIDINKHSQCHHA